MKQIDDISHADELKDPGMSHWTEQEMRSVTSLCNVHCRVPTNPWYFGWPGSHLHSRVTQASTQGAFRSVSCSSHETVSRSCVHTESSQRIRVIPVCEPERVNAAFTSWAGLHQGKWGLQQENPPTPPQRLPRHLERCSDCDAPRAWRGYLWAWRFADWMPGLWESTWLILMSHRWDNSVAGKTACVRNASKNTEQMWAQLQHSNWHLYSLHLERNSNII